MKAIIHAKIYTVTGPVYEDGTILFEDGKIVAADLPSIREFVLDSSASYELSADTNGDGLVDSRDIVRLKKYLAGLSVSLGKS